MVFLITSLTGGNPSGYPITTHSRENPLVTASIDRRRSLEELERDRWQAPPPDATRLIATAHALRSRPVGTLTVEDLRLLIGQDIGLPVSRCFVTTRWPKATCTRATCCARS
ncbi:contact-dependent growth inhibition system immunity protein [Streptomyces sp. NPDC024089]|uniref:contact-dependent growth inhibition system immunity protein n=1 Tax=Streptomyces sp. NPDC024089 TaxID=3154328 RepID=UPI0033DD98BE